VSSSGHVTVAGKSFKVIGISKAPLGGQASDIYIPLAQAAEALETGGPDQRAAGPRNERGPGRAGRDADPV